MSVNSATSATHADSKIRFEWMVNFWNVCSSSGVFIESPIFSSGLNHDLTWQMKICVDKFSKNTMSLYVRLIGSKNDAEVRAKLKFFILRHTGTPLFTGDTAISTFVPGTSADTFGFDNFVSVSYLDDIIKTNPVYTNVNVVCEMEEIQISDGQKVAVPSTILACPILDNLRSLFESKKFSDVELTISGQASRAHKLVLMMHSPVFSAMFEHETVEKICKEVEITDVTPAVFNEMLRFMYTGAVMDIEKIADGLLIAADKYAVERLKVMCEEALYKKLVVENAADTLILADTHNAAQLKSRVLKFIASSATDVQDTRGFQSMVQSHSHLVAETLRAVLEMQKR